MQSIDFNRGIWLVAATPSMGLVVGSAQEADTKAIVASILSGRAVTFDPCFGLKSEGLPMQGPRGELGITMLRQAMPLANLQGAGKLHTRITGALFFCEMDETDQRRHKGLVEQLATQIAAARSSIVVASPGDLPDGKLSKS